MAMYNGPLFSEVNMSAISAEIKSLSPSITFLGYNIFIISE